MCKFTFMYSDWNSFSISDVEEVQYSWQTKQVVSEDELATHDFPLDTDLFCLTPDGSRKVSCKGLISITVKKQN